MENKKHLGLVLEPEIHAKLKSMALLFNTYSILLFTSRKYFILKISKFGTLFSLINLIYTHNRYEMRSY